MYTETDLRQMLRASADRADESTSPTPQVSMLRQIDRERRQTRRRVIAPVAVAACTAAVIAGVVALTQRPSPAHTASAADPAPSTALHMPPRSTAGSTMSQPASAPAVPITDEVRTDTQHYTGNFVSADGTDKGGQEIISQIGHDRTVHLVIAPAAAFDDSTIPRTHQVAIAGTTGYYAILRLYPLSANGHGGSPAAGTIVFRTPDRNWAFASLQAGTKNDTVEGSPVNDPRAIAQGFDSLHATFTSGSFRTPLRIGYLPAHTTITAADNYTSSSRLSEADISAHSAGKNMKEIDISITHPDKAYGPADDRRLCPPVPDQPCTSTRHRDLPGGYVLEVQGTDYSEAETQNVIDHITVASDLLDPSTFFVLSEPNE